MGIPSEQAAATAWIQSLLVQQILRANEMEETLWLATPHDEKIHIKKILESHAFDKNRFFFLEKNHYWALWNFKITPYYTNTFVQQHKHGVLK